MSKKQHQRSNVSVLPTPVPFQAQSCTVYVCDYPASVLSCGERIARETSKSRTRIKKSNGRFRANMKRAICCTHTYAFFIHSTVVAPKRLHSIGSDNTPTAWEHFPFHFEYTLLDITMLINAKPRRDLAKTLDPKLLKGILKEKSERA